MPPASGSECPQGSVIEREGDLIFFDPGSCSYDRAYLSPSENRPGAPPNACPLAVVLETVAGEWVGSTPVGSDARPAYHDGEDLLKLLYHALSGRVTRGITELAFTYAFRRKPNHALLTVGNRTTSSGYRRTWLDRLYPIRCGRSSNRSSPPSRQSTRVADLESPLGRC